MRTLRIRILEKVRTSRSEYSLTGDQKVEMKAYITNSVNETENGLIMLDASYMKYSPASRMKTAPIALQYLFVSFRLVVILKKTIYRKRNTSV